MSASQAEVEQVIRDFLARANKPVETLDAGLPLYGDGIGLDSLETAELSALLEDAFGNDPYQSGDMPQKVGDILAFYDGVAAQA